MNILQTLQPSFQQPAMNSVFMDLVFFFPCSAFVAAKEQLHRFAKLVPLKKGTCALRNTKDALQAVGNAMLIT